MEAVLRLETPGTYIVPWKQIVSGCLVIIFISILYISIENYAEDMEGSPRAKTAEYLFSLENAVVDMSGLCEKEAVLGTVKDAGKKEMVRGIELDPAVVKGLSEPENIDFMLTGLGAVSSVRPGTAESAAEEKAPGVITVPAGIGTAEALPIPGISMDPGETENPGKADRPLIPGISVDPGEEGNPGKAEAPLIPGISVDPGETENPGKAEAPSIPGISVDPGETESPGFTEKPGITEEPGITDTEITKNPDKAKDTDDVITEEPADEEIRPKVIDGFVIDSEGYITGCTEQVMIIDDILIFPASDRCVGVRSGALDFIAAQVTEVYIPANISSIEFGVFDRFLSLMYVEVSEDNPGCYSREGILYTSAGEVLADPAGR